VIIGIDASFANYAVKTGVEWCAYHLVLALSRIDRTNEFRLYLRGPPRNALAELPSNFHPVILPNRRFWVHTSLAWELMRNPVDVFFAPSHIVPWYHPSRTIATIHDVGFRHFRSNYRFYQFAHIAVNLPRSVKWATAVVTPSEFVARDVTSHFRLTGKPVYVVPNGFDEEMFNSISEDECASVRRRYGIGQNSQFLLVLGRMEVRKNLIRTLQAFFELGEAFDDISLVLAGPAGVGHARIREMIASHPRGRRVHETGYVSARDRAVLLKEARALVFVSLYEGFGIPILEAFAAATPVLTSNTTACAEVAGSAALLVDPLDTAAITQSIADLISDEPLRQRLIDAGLRRVSRFGWDSSAAVIHRIILGATADISDISRVR
jgi:glycosyltransferase involved in cell wall biosynthesis